MGEPSPLKQELLGQLERIAKIPDTQRVEFAKRIHFVLGEAERLRASYQSRRRYDPNPEMKEAKRIAELASKLKAALESAGERTVSWIETFERGPVRHGISYYLEETQRLFEAASAVKSLARPRHRTGRLCHGLSQQFAVTVYDQVRQVGGTLSADRTNGGSLSRFLDLLGGISKITTPSPRVLERLKKGVDENSLLSR